MGCSKLEDVEAWTTLLMTHVDLRPCFRYLTDRINFEIPDLNLSLASDLLDALRRRLNFLNGRVLAINQDIGCIHVMFEGITLPNPEFLRFLDILREREAALQLELDEVNQAIERIPQQMVDIESIAKEMACQKYNANFLSGILNKVEGGVGGIGGLGGIV